MKNFDQFKWICGFLVLNIFANGIPFLVMNYPETKISFLFREQPFYWFVFWLSFFLLVFLLAKFFLKLKGLNAMGLKFRRNLFGELSLGLLAGFLLWGIKNLIFYCTGMFQITGLINFSAIPQLLALALVISFFPAAVNDLLIRGYFFAWLKKYNLMPYFIFVTAFIYAIDDFWNEGFSGTNLVFSLLLGTSLAISVVRTGAIWMSIGIHTGSNFVYRMMYGLDGQGIFILEDLNSSPIYDYINILMVIFLLPVVFLFPGYRKQQPVVESEGLINKGPEVV